MRTVLLDKENCPNKTKYVSTTIIIKPKPMIDHFKDVFLNAKEIFTIVFVPSVTSVIFVCFYAFMRIHQSWFGNFFQQYFPEKA